MAVIPPKTNRLESMPMLVKFYQSHPENPENPENPDIRQIGT